MKYRISKENNCEGKIYYPQYKTFLFWHYFKKAIAPEVYNYIGYKHLDGALDFINKNKNDRAWQKVCRSSWKKEIIEVD